MKKSRTFWSISGAFGVMAIGAGIAVAQPGFPINGPVNLHEGVRLPGPSSVERDGDSTKAEDSPSQVAESLAPPGSPVPLTQPTRYSAPAAPTVSAKSAVSPISAVSAVSATSAVSPVSAASAISAWSPQSPQSPVSAPSAASAD